MDDETFKAAYESSDLDARPQKVADLFLLLTAIGGVALRLRWPAQKGRPRSDADIDQLVQRVERAAAPALLDADLCRVLLRTLVKRERPYEDRPTSRSALYTAALVCDVAIDNSLQNAVLPSDRETRFHIASRAVRRQLKIAPIAAS